MNAIKDDYKKTVNLIGIVMIVFTVLFESLFTAYFLIEMIVYTITEHIAAEIILSIIYDIVYLASFMLPALLMLLLCRKRGMQPLRFNTNINADTFAWIFIGVACTFAFSYINAFAISFFPSFDMGGIEDAYVYTKDYGLVLQFITIALVPGFCEEFLFRGVLLSNLMPYGKSTAIIISSVCFGLMHGNFAQFLYATAAGIVFGLIYVKTDSMWPSTFAHIINNSLSVLQLSLIERLEDNAASTAWFALNTVIFLLGAIGVIILIKKLKHIEQIPMPVFQKRLSLEYESASAPVAALGAISAKNAVRYFFCPAMTVFIFYTVFKSLYTLFI